MVVSRAGGGGRCGCRGVRLSPHATDEDVSEDSFTSGKIVNGKVATKLKKRVDLAFRDAGPRGKLGRRHSAGREQGAEFGSGIKDSGHIPSFT
jgi:hypothetical protein